LELNTRIFTYEKLEQISLDSVDAVYLGDPFAPQYEGNLCFDMQKLSDAIDFLTQRGKKAYISTFAVPRNKDLPLVEEQLKFISEQNLAISAVEAHNTGVLQAINEILPEMPVHMGCMSNIYTDSTVHLLKSFGVRRVSPNSELCLDELELIKDECGITVEILIHGRMILGISEECPVKWWTETRNAEIGEEKVEKSEMPDYCTQAINLDSEKMQLTVRGRVTMSGKDVCMLEHIPLLAEKGFDTFHIDSSVVSAQQFNRTAHIYRQAFNIWAEVMPDREKYAQIIKPQLEELFAMNSAGLCNGYYFRTSGSGYVPGFI
jgi:putative protease